MATNPSLELWVRLGAVHPLGAWCSQYNLNRWTGTAGKFAQNVQATILSIFGMRLPDPRVFCPHSEPGCLDWSSDRSDQAIPRRLWHSCRDLVRAVNRFSLSMEPSSQQIRSPPSRMFPFCNVQSSLPSLQCVHCLSLLKGLTHGKTKISVCLALQSDR